MAKQQHEDASDLLYDLGSIAAYLRITPRQAKHRALGGQLPTFKIGRNVCARKPSLGTWLAECEAEARSRLRLRQGRDALRPGCRVVTRCDAQALAGHFRSAYHSERRQTDGEADG